MKFKFWLVYIYMLLFLSLMGQSVLFLNLLDVESSSYYLYQIALYAMSILLIFNNLEIFSRHSVLKLACLYFIFAFVISVLKADSLGLRSLFAIAFNTAAMPLALSVGIVLSKQISTKWQDLILLLAQVPAFVNCFFLLSFPFGVTPDAVFSIFVFMPFCFFIKRKWLSYLLLLVYLLAILLTAKRSVLIAYSVCVTFFILYNLFLNNTQKAWQRYIFVAAILFFGYNYISTKVEYIDGVKDRFERLQDNAANGRDDIWTHYANKMSESDMSDILFGHGYASVLRDLGRGAHNDILEILYDYGIIVLIIYIVFFIKVFRYLTKSIKISYLRDISTNGLITCLVVLMLSMFNCILASNLYIFVLFAIMGMSIGFVQNVKK